MTANRAATPYLDDGDLTLYHGDAITVLQSLPSGIAQTCVTSPPYWGLRSYLEDGHTDKHVELGLEATPTQYVERLVSVFREVRRVLRDDGTLWLNLGDSYASGPAGNAPDKPSGFSQKNGRREGGCVDIPARSFTDAGLKPKDLVGIPWSVAKAMQQPYYTGRIIAERDRVWLAATIDAEGSICGFHHTRADDGSTRTGIHVTITNASIALLDEAHRIWPTSRADHNPHGNGHLGKREMRRWIAHNVDDKALLLRELYPYLIAKRQQALLAWNFLEMSKASKRIGKLAEGREAKARRSWIVHALSALNRGDEIDVPGWIVEPPALFEPGWYLRSDIIWAKPNPMPESVTDRPTKSHEYLFLFSKQPRYFYDADAIREPHSAELHAPGNQKWPNGDRNDGDRMDAVWGNPAGRNRRSVWQIPTEPFPEAHFATYPQELVRPCIQAGTSERGGCAECGAPWWRVIERTRVIESEAKVNGYNAASSALRGSRETSFANNAHTVTATTGWDPSCTCAATATPQTVLDPFVGSGTTALVARKHGRRCIGIDLSAEYLALAAKRTQQLSLLGGVS